MIKPAFSGSGIFEIEMALFETRRLKKMRSDYTFGSMDQLNVKIAPKTSQNLTIRAKNCWITDKNRKENLTLIDNYCPNPDLRLFFDTLNLNFGFEVRLGKDSLITDFCQNKTLFNTNQ